MSEVQYWMFGNAFLLLLDVQAIILLGLHLWLKRKELKTTHLVSLAFLIYLLGQGLFRTLYWDLWRNVTNPDDFRAFANNLVLLFRLPVAKVASVLNMIGLVMIVAVLTWNIRYLWIYATLTALFLASVSIWL